MERIKRSLVFALLLVFGWAYHCAAQETSSRAALKAVESATPLTVPPQQFESLWNEVADRCTRIAHSCQVQRAIFDEVQFYTMPGPFRCNTVTDATCIGQAWVNAGRIYLDRNKLGDKRLVQHEMLHLILGTANHPDEFAFLNLLVKE